MLNIFTMSSRSGRPMGKLPLGAACLLLVLLLCCAKTASNSSTERPKTVAQPVDLPGPSSPAAQRPAISAKLDELSPEMNNEQPRPSPEEVNWDESICSAEEAELPAGKQTGWLSSAGGALGSKGHSKGGSKGGDKCHQGAEFHCALEDRCVPIGWRCDFAEQCLGGDDERGCLAERCDLSFGRCGWLDAVWLDTVWQDAVWLDAVHPQSKWPAVSGDEPRETSSGQALGRPLDLGMEIWRPFTGRQARGISRELSRDEAEGGQEAGPLSGRAGGAAGGRLAQVSQMATVLLRLSDLVNRDTFLYVPFKFTQASLDLGAPEASQRRAADASGAQLGPGSSVAGPPPEGAKSAKLWARLTGAKLGRTNSMCQLRFKYAIWLAAAHELLANGQAFGQQKLEQLTTGGQLFTCTLSLVVQLNSSRASWGLNSSSLWAHERPIWSRSFSVRVGGHSKAEGPSQNGRPQSKLSGGGGGSTGQTGELNHASGPPHYDTFSHTNAQRAAPKGQQSNAGEQSGAGQAPIYGEARRAEIEREPNWMIGVAELGHLRGAQLSLVAELRREREREGASDEEGELARRGAKKSQEKARGESVGQPKGKTVGGETILGESVVGETVVGETVLEGVDKSVWRPGGASRIETSGGPIKEQPRGAASGTFGPTGPIWSTLASRKQSGSRGEERPEGGEPVVRAVVGLKWLRFHQCNWPAAAPTWRQLDDWRPLAIDLNDYAEETGREGPSGQQVSRAQGEKAKKEPRLRSSDASGASDAVSQVTAAKGQQKFEGPQKLEGHLMQARGAQMGGSGPEGDSPPSGGWGVSGSAGKTVEGGREQERGKERAGKEEGECAGGQEFRCSSGLCVAWERVCNFVDDCMEAESNGESNGEAPMGRRKRPADGQWTPKGQQKMTLIGSGELGAGKLEAGKLGDGKLGAEDERADLCAPVKGREDFENVDGAKWGSMLGAIKSGAGEKRGGRGRNGAQRGGLASEKSNDDVFWTLDGNILDGLGAVEGVEKGPKVGARVAVVSNVGRRNHLPRVDHTIGSPRGSYLSIDLMEMENESQPQRERGNTSDTEEGLATQEELLWLSLNSPWLVKVHQASIGGSNSSSSSSSSEKSTSLASDCRLKFFYNLVTTAPFDDVSEASKLPFGVHIKIEHFTLRKLSGGSGGVAASGQDEQSATLHLSAAAASSSRGTQSPKEDSGGNGASGARDAAAIAVAVERAVDALIVAPVYRARDDNSNNNNTNTNTNGSLELQGRQWWRELLTGASLSANSAQLDQRLSNGRQTGPNGVVQLIEYSGVDFWREANYKIGGLQSGDLFFIRLLIYAKYSATKKGQKGAPIGDRPAYLTTMNIDDLVTHFGCQVADHKELSKLFIGSPPLGYDIFRQLFPTTNQRRSKDWSLLEEDIRVEINNNGTRKDSLFFIHRSEVSADQSSDDQNSDDQKQKQKQNHTLGAASSSLGCSGQPAAQNRVQAERLIAYVLAVFLLIISLIAVIVFVLVPRVERSLISSRERLDLGLGSELSDAPIQISSWQEQDQPQLHQRRPNFNRHQEAASSASSSSPVSPLGTLSSQSSGSSSAGSLSQAPPSRPPNSKGQRGRGGARAGAKLARPARAPFGELVQTTSLLGLDEHQQRGANIVAEGEFCPKGCPRTTMESASCELAAPEGRRSRSKVPQKFLLFPPNADQFEAPFSPAASNLPPADETASQRGPRLTKRQGRADSKLREKTWTDKEHQQRDSRVAKENTADYWPHSSSNVGAPETSPSRRAWKKRGSWSSDFLGNVRAQRRKMDNNYSPDGPGQGPSWAKGTRRGRKGAPARQAAARISPSSSSSFCPPSTSKSGSSSRES